MSLMIRCRRAVLVLSGFAVAPLCDVHAQAPSTLPPSPILATSGQGEAKVTPDRASVLVSVQTRGASASASGAENAQRTTAVLDALKKLGLSKEQLSTEGYSATPDMRYDKDGTAHLVSYVVTNSIRAETRRPEQVGAIVDAALGAGANLISSLSFYASSIDEARRQAISAAVASARADADAIAKAAGGAVGDLIEISTGGPTVPPRPRFEVAARTMAAQGVDATQINPGQQTVTVFISAKWKFVAGR